MAIDMDADIGTIFKNLFSKKEGGSPKTGKGSPADPFMKIIITGGVFVILVILYLFFIYFPLQEENRINTEKTIQIDNVKTCINNLSDDILKATKDLNQANKRYNNLTKLFHTDKEFENLYRSISELARVNNLNVTKLEKAGKDPFFEIEQSQGDLSGSLPSIEPPPISPISEDINNVEFSDPTQACEAVEFFNSTLAVDGGGSDNFNDTEFIEGGNLDEDMPPMDDAMGVEGEKVLKKVAYYEIKSNFEISGNYSNYTDFRKGLAQHKKKIKINQEKIKVLESEKNKGQVKVSVTLSTYRLPTNDAEIYISSEEEIQ
jgi:Tfp pilus assembly protein PilO